VLWIPITKYPAMKGSRAGSKKEQVSLEERGGSLSPTGETISRYMYMGQSLSSEIAWTMSAISFP